MGCDATPESVFFLHNVLITAGAVVLVGSIEGGALHAGLRKKKKFGGAGGLAQGLGIRLFAFGGAYWPLATAHSDPLWARTCFGCVTGAPG